MADQAQKARRLTELHVKGDPLIIYNIWDPGSAKAVAGCGAKAIATGDHPVGYAHGFDDDNFGDFSFEVYLTTVKEIAGVIGDLPLSIDISNAEGLSAEALNQRVHQVIDAGGVGVNFEDRLPDSSGVASIEDHVPRIETIREAAEEADIPLHINARTDLFSTADPSGHSGLIEEAISRAEAYRQAGANSLFVPMLNDLELIRDLCKRCSLPVNIIRLSEDAPTTHELAEAGVARISYGPRPQMEMIEWLKGKAREALDS